MNKIRSYAPLRSFGEQKTGRIPHEKTVFNGIEFDSLAEKDRYLELLVMQRAGIISDLECHPEFEIIPKQKHPETGKFAFHPAHYTADFRYKRDGKVVVEDVKSQKTREEKDWILRRKLMLYVNGIYVEEVVR